jgi:hypothetical protein
MNFLWQNEQLFCLIRLYRYKKFQSALGIFFIKGFIERHFTAAGRAPGGAEKHYYRISLLTA